MIINHFVANDTIIACGFDDPRGEQASDVLAAAYPGRDVVMIDASPLFARDGGIHCITQQQPRMPAGFPRKNMGIEVRSVRSVP